MNSSPRWTALGLLAAGTTTGLAAWWCTSASDVPSTPTAARSGRAAPERPAPSGSLEVRRDELDASVALAEPAEWAPLPLSSAMASGDSAVLLTAQNTSRVLRAPAAVECEIRQLAADEDHDHRRLLSLCIQELAAEGSAERRKKRGIRRAASKSPSQVSQLFDDLRKEARLHNRYKERMGGSS